MLGTLALRLHSPETSHTFLCILLVIRETTYLPVTHHHGTILHLPPPSAASATSIISSAPLHPSCNGPTLITSHRVCSFRITKCAYRGTEHFNRSHSILITTPKNYPVVWLTVLGSVAITTALVRQVLWGT